jgi:hypothetical protein
MDTHKKTFVEFSYKELRGRGRKRFKSGDKYGTEKTVLPSEHDLLPARFFML